MPTLSRPSHLLEQTHLRGETHTHTHTEEAETTLDQDGGRAGHEQGRQDSMSDPGEAADRQTDKQGRRGIFGADKLAGDSSGMRQQIPAELSSTDHGDSWTFTEGQTPDLLKKSTSKLEPGTKPAPPILPAAGGDQTDYLRCWWLGRQN